MKHRFAILCERVSVDQDSNTLSLFNVIEEIGVQYTGTKPQAGSQQVVPQPFTLAILTERTDIGTPENGTIRVSFVDHLGKELLKPMSIPVDLQHYIRTRSNIRGNAIPVTSEGVYKFIIEHQDRRTGSWKKVAETPVVVRLQPSAGASQPATKSKSTKKAAKKRATRTSSTRKSTVKKKPGKMQARKGNGKTP